MRDIATNQNATPALVPSAGALQYHRSIAQLFTRPETSQYLKMIKAKPAVPHPRRVRNGNQVECVYWPSTLILM
jgi:hypothetical protein